MINLNYVYKNYAKTILVYAVYKDNTKDNTKDDYIIITGCVESYSYGNNKVEKYEITLSPSFESDIIGSVYILNENCFMTLKEAENRLLYLRKRRISRVNSKIKKYTRLLEKYKNQLN